MKKISEHLISLIVAFIAMVVANALVRYCHEKYPSNRNCDDLSRISELRVNHVVNHKFKNYNAHGHLFVVCKGRSLSFRDNSLERPLYEKIDIGDSLYKKAGESLLFIQKRNHLEIIDFDTVFICNE